MTLWLTPLVPLCAAPLLYCLVRNTGRKLMATLAVATALLTALLAIQAVQDAAGARYAWSETIVLQLAISPVTSVFLITVPLIAALILWFAALHEQAKGLNRLLALLMVFVGAMQLLVLAADMLTLLIAWEIVSACSWALIAHHWHESENVTAASRAFLVSRLGDLGLFIAAFTAFAATGSFAYTGLEQIEGPWLQVFAAGVLVAAAAKSAQLPFSPWLFSAMAGPVSVSALLHAATMVAAGVFILIRLHDVLAGVAWFGPLVTGIGLATALIAGLVATAQLHVKKLLAASTSAHYGFMWTAVGAGFPAVAALHFVAHAVMKAGLFLAAGVAGSAAGSYDLRALRVGGQRPVFTLATLIISLALAGIFPLGAGWTKEKIIGAASHVDVTLALLAMLAGALSAAYAARWQRHIAGSRDTSADKSLPPEAAATHVAAAGSLALSLLWWPGLHEPIETFFTTMLPPSKAWETVLSLSLLVLGGVIGLLLSARADRLAQSPAACFIAQWLALPVAGKRLLERPLWSGARALARWDARFDRGLCAFAGSVGGGLTRGLAVQDDRFDNRLRKYAMALEHPLARWDESVVNRSLMSAVTVSAWLARVSARGGEALADLLPDKSARWSKLAAGVVRRLQTGLSHHYYALAAAGMVVFVIAIVIGVVL